METEACGILTFYLGIQLTVPIAASLNVPRLKQTDWSLRLLHEANTYCDAEDILMCLSYELSVPKVPRSLE